MSNLLHMPLLMGCTSKAPMTKFARTLQPGIFCEYEKVTDLCFVVKIDFERQEDYRRFLERYWKVKK